ncbi:MAG: CrcB family protein [Propionicimonas sp.]|nr:CrcB family protein [Propionicimonas sp.]
MTPLLVALAGGLGAAARFTVDGWVARANRTGLPLGTVVINVTGSFLLGLLTGWLLTGAAGDVGAVLGTGFLGGYTTFSTASVEAARLLRAGRGWAALVHAGGMLVAGLAAAALGVWLVAGR